MSPLRFILASLWHYRRVQLAVAAGVAVATAVITGALLVGDSVRGSLRDLALERLGRIDSVLVAQQPFRAALAGEIARVEAAPLLLTPGTIEAVRSGEAEGPARGRAGSRAKRAVSSPTTARRATQLSVIGCNNNFWRLGSGGPAAPLAEDGLGITRSLATELDVSVGDEVLLRVPLAAQVPADSTLGEKDQTTTARRLRIAAVLENKGLARFSLRPSQHQPRNVFLALGTLQKLLGIGRRANAIAVAGPTPPPEVRPRLDDFGLQVQRHHVGGPAGSDVLQLTAGRLVLPSHVVERAQREFAQQRLQSATTYLANTIAVGQRKIPYSTLTGVDSTAALGPLWDEQGRPLLLANDEIVLNDWAAKDLNAQVGDLVTITFYDPETTHGRLHEHRPVRLKLRAIVPLRDSAGQPTWAADPRLTPELAGVTDQRSIHDWDLPFRLVEKIRPQDEDYWDQYRTTPKAFVSSSLARQLWKTRWGVVSLLRLPATEKLTVAEFERRLSRALDPAALGMSWLPVKQQGLQAAHGTTSFDGLFLGFSFFLMASAVMLVVLLFRLGLEQRAREVGVLSAVGLSARKLRRLLVAEAAIVALGGAAVGVAAGVGYARLMIQGLNTWWVAATVTPFLKLHVSSASLAWGWLLGVAVALLTILWSLRKLVRLPAQQLLAGNYEDSAHMVGGPDQARRWLPRAMLAAAAALAIPALRLEGEAQAGAFFGSGALVLAALLTGLRQRLRQPDSIAPQRLSLAGLALRNARRNPARTILSVGLAAVASFLIIALSAFRLAPTRQGTGGFDLIATADQPIYFDLNTSEGRRELGFSDRDNRQLAGVEVRAFRVQAGEDASCLNLYQTTQPRVLGVPRSFYDEGAFGWSATANLSPEQPSPWQLLDAELGPDAAGRTVVPVVLDKNTAVYSLHLGGVGSQWTIRDATDQPVTLEIVGLLAGSILQGDLLMSETNFLQLFPETQGSRMFLIRAGNMPYSIEALTTLLETRLEDYGLDAQAARDRLAGLMAVQNTYLSTFQSLGALGLLLGTFGLAVAQLRSVLERRGELALMQSAGFRRRRLAKMVLGENVVLLVGGLGIGCLAALAAVLPHWLLRQATMPWATLAGLLLAVAVAGLAAGWLAVRAVLRAPLLPALRGD